MQLKGYLAYGDELASVLWRQGGWRDQEFFQNQPEKNPSKLGSWKVQ